MPKSILFYSFSNWVYSEGFGRVRKDSEGFGRVRKGSEGFGSQCFCDGKDIQEWIWVYFRRRGLSTYILDRRLIFFRKWIMLSGFFVLKRSFMIFYVAENSSRIKRCWHFVNMCFIQYSFPYKYFVRGTCFSMKGCDNLFLPPCSRFRVVPSLLVSLRSVFFVFFKRWVVFSRASCVYLWFIAVAISLSVFGCF